MNDQKSHSIKVACERLIEAIGGPKEVGCSLFGKADPEGMSKKLLHCLDPDRREKLSLKEWIWLMREGNRAGFHDFKHKLDELAGYQPSAPLTPADERAELLKEVKAVGQQMGDLMARLEAME